MDRQAAAETIRDTFESPKKGNGIVNTPACGDCGTDEAVELITFTDKDTGELKRRLKCQACGKWLGKAS